MSARVMSRSVMRVSREAAGVPFLFKQHGEWIGVPDLRNLPGGAGPGFGLDGVQHDGYPTP